jgi:hypothetical protein
LVLLLISYRDSGLLEIRLELDALPCQTAHQRILPTGVVVKLSPRACSYIQQTMDLLPFTALFGGALGFLEAEGKLTRDKIES